MFDKPLKAVILAAGKGTRLRTEGEDLPKVMRLAAGKPLLGHVLSALDFIPDEDKIVVVGYKREYVTDAFPQCSFAVQEQQLGTGHAVMSAFSALEGYEGHILVCCGDMPLIRRETYLAVVQEHMRSGAACTLLTGYSAEELPYGRIIRDDEGNFSGIVEDRDCTPQQKAIRELNSGVYVFEASNLKRALTGLKNNNSQGEYYLTDAPLLIAEDGLPVAVCCRDLGYEIIGVNTLEQLNQVEKLLLE